MAEDTPVAASDLEFQIVRVSEHVPTHTIPENLNQPTLTPIEAQRVKADKILKLIAEKPNVHEYEGLSQSVLTDMQDSFDHLLHSDDPKDVDLYWQMMEIHQKLVARFRPPKNEVGEKPPTLAVQLAAVISELNGLQKPLPLDEIAAKFNKLDVPESETTILTQRSALARITTDLGTLTDEELGQLKAQLNPAIVELVGKQIKLERPAALKAAEVAQQRRDALKLAEEKRLALDAAVAAYNTAINEKGQTLEGLLAASDTYNAIDTDGRHNRFIGDIARFLRSHQQSQHDRWNREDGRQVAQTTPPPWEGINPEATRSFFKARFEDWVARKNLARQAELDQAKTRLAEWLVANDMGNSQHDVDAVYSADSPLSIVYGEVFSDYSDRQKSKLPDELTQSAVSSLERRQRSEILQTTENLKRNIEPHWSSIGSAAHGAIDRARDAVIGIDEYIFDVMRSTTAEIRGDLRFIRKGTELSWREVGMIIGTWGRQQSGQQGSIALENAWDGEIDRYIQAARQHLLDAGVPEDRLVDLTAEKLIAK